MDETRLSLLFRAQTGEENAWEMIGNPSSPNGAAENSQG
jgi:hypothetical protein